MILYAYLAVVIAAAACDVWRLRIPNLLTFGLGGSFFALALLNPLAVAWASHLGAGLLVLGAGALLFRLGLLGGGDVKLWAATSLWIGMDGLPLHVLLVALLGGALALLLLIVRTMVSRLLTALPAGRRTPLPRVLTPGEGIPYGVAIAGSSLLLHEQVAQLEAGLLSAA